MIGTDNVWGTSKIIEHKMCMPTGFWGLSQETEHAAEIKYLQIVLK